MPHAVNISVSTIITEVKKNCCFIEVQDTDVLGGSKNTSLRQHHGNVLLKELILDRLDEYERATTKQEKVQINRLVIGIMRKRYNSRFLRQEENGTWCQSDEQRIRDKISHAFRFACNQRKKATVVHKHRRQQQQQQQIQIGSNAMNRDADDSSINAATLATKTETTFAQSEEDVAFAHHLERVYQNQKFILQKLLMEKKPCNIDDDSTTEEESSCGY